MKKPLSNYQDLLKTLAIIAVYIDHAGLFFINDPMLRAVGRFAMPFFCFFVGYNYITPRIRLVYFGVVLSALFGLCLNMWFVNMLIVMYIGHWYLYMMDKYNFKSTRSIWAQLVVLLALMPFVYEYFEYGTLAIAYILVGYIYKQGARDCKMLLLVTLCNIYFAQYNFHFSYIDGVISAITLSITGCLLWFVAHDSPTKWDFRIISRNSIFLYFLNLVGSILYFSFAMYF